MYNNYYTIFPYDKNPTNVLKLELLLTSMIENVLFTFNMSYKLQINLDW